MSSTAWPTTQDLDDLQGDIVLGIPKRAETFIFFNIADVASFKKGLQQLLPAITTTTQVQQLRQDIADHKLQGSPDLLQISAINIAFTSRGLKELGVTEGLGDGPFDAGQKAHAKDLGDNGNQELFKPFDPDWLLAFKNEVDGVLLIAGDSDSTVLDSINKVQNIFASSFTEMFNVEGRVRPDKEKGHEHFGFLDGISFPAIRGMVDPFPGQTQVNPGVIVCGTNGDGTGRPAWAKNGSFLVYRHLQQFVPEFNTFLENNPIVDAQVATANRVELAGARLFGRWKSGAPVDITPFADDPVLANDPQRNNNFDFSENLNDQKKCPFAAHVRKSNPRADLTSIPIFGKPFVESHMIMRQSIPYGPEVDPDTEQFKTESDRGLAFVCYQSNIDNGFEFVQKTWANDVFFPPGKTALLIPLAPGFDPIIGQNGGGDRQMKGLQIDNPNQDTKLPLEFVVSKGGAYFFSPSITALKTKLSV